MFGAALGQSVSDRCSRGAGVRGGGWGGAALGLRGGRSTLWGTEPSGRPPQCGHLLWGLGRRAGPCEARDQQTKLADRLPHELTFGELTFGERPGPSWSPTRLIHATETDSRHSEQACGRPGGGGREGRGEGTAEVRTEGRKDEFPFNFSDGPGA